MQILLWLLIALFLLAIVVPRALPNNADMWHQPIVETEDKDLPGGAVRVIPGDAGTLAELDKALRALPRTTQIAGSLAEGRVTYLTRSLVFGFPDYTTIEQSGDQIRLFARLRIGRSDLGVNRKRLEQVIAALQP